MRAAWAAVLVAACGFDGSSPAELADAGGGAPDAERTVDAFVWDPAVCPQSYDVIPASGSSRYRIDLRPLNAWSQADGCAADLPGQTHLAALDDLTEVQALQAVIDGRTDLPSWGPFTIVWIGGVQQRMQIGPGVGWLTITGGPMLDGLWAPEEPNDWGSTTQTNGYEDDEEQIAGLWRTQTHLADMVGGALLGAVCECDGRPVDAHVQTELAATRP
jgi:hypothetical protein